MKESVFSFGEKNALTGVWCEPAAPRPGAPPVLFWNVGVQHHVGPYRIWVDLARRLAELGFRSLRFDLGNMGDSGVTGQPPAADVTAAINAACKRLGTSKVALIGFCSSVDQLHEVGLADERAAAMIYVEGYAYRTRRYWARYPLRFLSTVRWQKRIATRMKWTRLFDKTAGVMDAVEVEGGAGAMFDRRYPEPEQYVADLRRLSQRGTKVLLLYAGLDSSFAHPEQLHDLTGGRGLGDDVKLVFMGGVDHIFYRTEDRLLCIGELSRWLDQTFPPGR